MAGGLGLVLGVVFLCAALGSALKLIRARRRGLAAFDGGQRFGLILVGAFLFVGSLFCVMPDVFLWDKTMPVINSWSYGPERVLFGLCGMVTGGAFAICGLIDALASPRGNPK